MTPTQKDIDEVSKKAQELKAKVSQWEFANKDNEGYRDNITDSLDAIDSSCDDFDLDLEVEEEEESDEPIDEN